MIDHLEDGCVPETDILLLEGGYGVVADGVKDEFLSSLFDAEIVAVALLRDLVLRDKLLASRCCISRVECVGRVRSWVGWYRVCLGCVADDEPILGFGDRAGQVAVFLTLVVVVGLRHSEDSAELIFELVDCLRCDHAIEACQFVAEVD